VAEADTRDFRKSKWVKTSGGTGGEATATVEGGFKYQAALMELDFAVGDLNYTLSTQISILEPTKK
jgi:hypothetical protein